MEAAQTGEEVDEAEALRAGAVLHSRDGHPIQGRIAVVGFGQCLVGGARGQCHDSLTRLLRRAVIADHGSLRKGVRAMFIVAVRLAVYCRPGSRSEPREARFRWP